MYRKKLMTGFEPGSSGVKNDRNFCPVKICMGFATLRSLDEKYLETRVKLFCYIP